MAEKGRGCGYHRKHLKESSVQEIMQRINAGHTDAKISEQMSIAHQTIMNIRKGKSYVQFTK